jgi:hypothetical protein
MDTLFDAVLPGFSEKTTRWKSDDASKCELLHNPFKLGSNGASTSLRSRIKVSCPSGMQEMFFLEPSPSEFKPVSVQRGAHRMESQGAASQIRRSHSGAGKIP